MPMAASDTNLKTIVVALNGGEIDRIRLHGMQKV
jgi:hypothetical protein